MGNGGLQIEFVYNSTDSNNVDSGDNVRNRNRISVS